MTDASGKVPRVVVVGLGGLGCPALHCLPGKANLELVLLDDDVVDESNLGRQVLYTDRDIGRSKSLAARDALLARGVQARNIIAPEERLLPETARHWVQGADVVMEGADNYATKFLVADGCKLEGVPVVHGAALGWNATVWAVSPSGGPCYRCLFEDVPPGRAMSCESAGVIGAVTGIAGALMADLAASILAGAPRYGSLLSFEGRHDRLREVRIQARDACPLCGPRQSIFAVDERRYTRHTCAA